MDLDIWRKLRPSNGLTTGRAEAWQAHHNKLLGTARSREKKQ
jgi:hypothetical protein